MIKTLKTITALGLLILIPLSFAQAQEIMTAENYFDDISARYGKIQDFTASIVITRGEMVMRGKLYYRNPNLLRIDFTEPEDYEDQVLVTDGTLLTIYIPRYEVIMEQKLKRRSQAAVAGIASQEGLNILKKNYGVAYLTGPDPEPLDEGSKELVVKLKLSSRSTAEGFRQLVMAVGNNGLIRRITGITIGYEELIFDFIEISVNQNIPEARFKYDSPPYANVFKNFLFEAEE